MADDTWKIGAAMLGMMGVFVVAVIIGAILFKW